MLRLRFYPLDIAYTKYSTTEAQSTQRENFIFLKQTNHRGAEYAEVIETIHRYHCHLDRRERSPEALGISPFDRDDIKITLSTLCLCGESFFVKFLHRARLAVVGWALPTIRCMYKLKHVYKPLNSSCRCGVILNKQKNGFLCALCACVVNHFC